MGCDIHLYVEQRTENGWEAVQGINPWIARYKAFALNARERGENERAAELDRYVVEMETKELWVYEGWLYKERNYALFAMLADVRNNYDYKPICQPKGLPGDISDVVGKEAARWEEDGHNHSWLTLQELLTYDWDQTTTITGWVEKNVADKYRQTGKRPSYWFYDTTNRNNNYEQISWQVKYSEHVQQFLDYGLLKLKQYACPPEDIRIVFWFDN
ncbi:hypothetical protein [Brevibacillus porteri]|uniref:Uncharacterized protein n=1 Tax=Brevibacillus porteri TaxID=2126350 RepID=A0ABX5FS69_9BACL|nr:hypothetical protein [Brevibacillus porteri]MED1801822.1 hypothetical protein [Brevibacillus porteri]MED2134953.1 hypothetical protein [Brevibacillus porteri]MED2745475.1 hypothetical protein [Brevibacillus porteri]MED2815779.1 hypothetical protein [Brevibacillus porteri]MED2897617.1 hypothetical protein [Brevibacillus porteri]